MSHSWVIIIIIIIIIPMSLSHVCSMLPSLVITSGQETQTALCHQYSLGVQHMVLNGHLYSIETPEDWVFEFTSKNIRDWRVIEYCDDHLPTL